MYNYFKKYILFLFLFQKFKILLIVPFKGNYILKLINFSYDNSILVLSVYSFSFII